MLLPPPFDSDLIILEESFMKQMTGYQLRDDRWQSFALTIFSVLVDTWKNNSRTSIYNR